MRITRQATRQVQEVCIRIMFDNGEVERIARIERDLDGELYVRTALGRRYSADHIISILKGDQP